MIDPSEVAFIQLIEEFDSFTDERIISRLQAPLPHQSRFFGDCLFSLIDKALKHYKNEERNFCYGDCFAGDLLFKSLLSRRAFLFEFLKEHWLDCGAFPFPASHIIFIFPGDSECAPLSFYSPGGLWIRLNKVSYDFFLRRSRIVDSDHVRNSPTNIISAPRMEFRLKQAELEADLFENQGLAGFELFEVENDALRHSVKSYDDFVLVIEYNKLGFPISKWGERTETVSFKENILKWL